jgi:hypothetical protein
MRTDLPMDVIDERYICVSCEMVGFSPKSLEELGIIR